MGADLETLLAAHAGTIERGLAADRPGRDREVGVAWSQDGLELVFRGRQYAWPWAVRLVGAEEGQIVIYPTPDKVSFGPHRVAFRLGPSTRPDPTVKRKTTRQAGKALWPDLLDALSTLQGPYMVAPNEGQRIVHFRLVRSTPGALRVDIFSIGLVDPGQDPTERLEKVRKAVNRLGKQPAAAYLDGTDWRVRMPRHAGRKEDMSLDEFVQAGLKEKESVDKNKEITDTD